jgi:UDP-GlcNAc3NAcA epimerase
MIKIVTVVGARPQFIKAAAISSVIETRYSDKVNEIIVHTGQHYDANMSDVFFSELSIPNEKYNLEIGSGLHGEQTAKMITELEKVLLAERPDAMLVYGDTNSTLAGTIAASKLEIPIIHVEAGLRSFTKNVPEEINRIICDKLSTLLFVPTKGGITNLKKEGFLIDNEPPYTIDNPKVCLSGDVMYDLSLVYLKIATAQSIVLKRYDLLPEKYSLLTIHRQDNTNNPENLIEILSTLSTISKTNHEKFIFPIHPRTKKVLLDYFKVSKIELVEYSNYIQFIDPVTYIDMVMLEANSKMIITDSGGVQKEAYFYSKPCIILQNETPWIELLENGSSVLVGSNGDKIIDAYKKLSNSIDDFKYPLLYGEGKAAEFIISSIIKYL